MLIERKLFKSSCVLQQQRSASYSGPPPQISQHPSTQVNSSTDIAIKLDFEVSEFFMLGKLEH